MILLVLESVPTGETEPDLQNVDIHDVLSNERRQLTLRILAEIGESLTTRELSERVAEHETGERPPPRNIRQSAYVSLQQTHLPKLDRLGIIDYDTTAKRVTLTEQAEEVIGAMEPRKRPIRSEVVLAAALTGFFLLIVSRLGGTDLITLGADVLIGALLLIIAGVAGHRLR